MTRFSSTGSHGPRWNVPAGYHLDSTRFIDRSNAAALIRSRWMSDGTRRSHLRHDTFGVILRAPYLQSALARFSV